MNISFKGFYNTGIGVDINKQAHAILSNNTLYVRPPYVHLSLTTTLNNNGVNDKEIFGEILKKFPNKYQKDTINFHYDKYFSPYQKKYKQEFWLNDRPLILRDENLSIFSKLAQLFTKLSEAKQLGADKYYIYSDECRANFNYFFMKGKQNLLEDFHKPSNVRAYAKGMADEFFNIMIEYFNR